MMMKLDSAWIDRIFVRMNEIFGERWSAIYSDERREAVGKTCWASGLHGLSINEIKAAINLCKSIDEPPTAVEFYHYAKGIRYPVIKRKNTEYQAGNKEIANQYLSEIKSKFKGKYDNAR